MGASPVGRNGAGVSGPSIQALSDMRIRDYPGFSRDPRPARLTVGYPFSLTNDRVEDSAPEASMSPHFATRAALMSLIVALGACADGARGSAPRAQTQFSNILYATWTDAEPPYRLYPGDELDVQVPSAPELNKTVTVQPDGRISLPLIDPVMVADRSVVDAQAALSRAYARELLRPQVRIGVRTSPLKVFVGGEVDKPGVYDMPGDINALQAVIMAGGFRTSAKRDDVLIIRRGPEGRAMMRSLNLVRGIRNPAGTDLVPLRRFDVVYVPRSNISNAGLFVQQYLRDVMPVSVGFSYATGGVSTF
jgi:protein involved in polysaccharide export with SLBB domain